MWVPSIVTGAATMAIMGLVMGDIVLRNIRGRGITGTAEYTEYLLVVVAISSVVVAERSRSHVAVDLVLTKLRTRFGAIVPITIYIVGAIASLLLVVWLIGATGALAIDSFTKQEFRFIGAVDTLILWPARAVIAIGFVLFCLHMFNRIRAGVGDLYAEPPPANAPAGLLHEGGDDRFKDVV